MDIQMDKYLKDLSDARIVDSGDKLSQLIEKETGDELDLEDLDNVAAARHSFSDFKKFAEHKKN